VEAKDPAKKGHADRMRKFFASQRKFLEDRVSEDPDYDPTNDPKYRKFLEVNEPKLSSSERKRFTQQRMSEEAETRAVERARKEMEPKIQAAHKRILEMEEGPKVERRTQTFMEEVAKEMPSELHKFYEENGKDLKKLEEEFPIEYPIVARAAGGAANLCKQFLQFRSGLVSFDTANPAHAYIRDFVESQARTFQERGGAALLRDGKRFVPPSEWSPEQSATTWTFDNEMVLTMIRENAVREAKESITREKDRALKAAAAYQRRVAVQSGASTPPATPEPESPKAVVSPTAGAASSAPTDESGLLASLLGLGSTK
jgi:hypothetical protein